MRWVLTVTVMLVAANVAHADERGAMTEYFAGEKRGGFVLVGMGVAGAGTGAALFATSDSGTIERGLSYPLLGMGAAHLAAGVFVYLASRGRERAFATEIAGNSRAWSVRERKRLAGVAMQFKVLKIVEVVLIAGGLTIGGVGHSTERPQLAGIGYGLALEAAATLVFDVVAARRVYRYREALDARPAVHAAAPRVELGLTPVLGHAMHF
jgi:hypothetical protein